MRRTPLRSMFLVIAVVALGASAAIAAPTPPDGFEYVPETERITLGIGCQQGAGGTCDSVEYWLGKSAGQGNVGNTGTFTPLNYVAHAEGDDVEFATFMADDSLAPTYVLRGDEPIAGQVVVGGWAGGAELAADSTVRVVLSAFPASGGFTPVALGDVEVNKPVVTPGNTTYAFEIPANDELDGVEVSSLMLTLYVRSVAVLQNGFVNGSGGSWFDLPYYEVVPVP